MNNILLGINLEYNMPHTPVGFKISIDDTLLYNELITHHKTAIQVNIKDDIFNNKIKLLNLIMYGKTAAHTTFNNEGDVIQSAILHVIDMYLDDTLYIYRDGMAHNLWDIITYHHTNNNEHGEKIIEPVSTTMGCNGKLVIPIYSPLHIWMYENHHGTKSI